MNHLIAKTKGRQGGYYKVFSNQEVFTLPETVDNRQVYNPSYKLDEEEWFEIPNFSSEAFCIDLFQRRFISTEYNQIPIDQYNKIEFLCSYQTGIFYLQNLSPGKILRKNWFSCSPEPTLQVNKPIIVIDSAPCAIFIKDEDVLIFKNLSSITSIFQGIDMLFREATREETEAFLASDFIRLREGFTADNVKTPNRKRIALAMEKLDGYTPEDRRSICDYIRDYCGSLPFSDEDGNFTISTEEELKQLLYGLDERYYTTLHGKEKRLANSVKTL